MTAGEQLIYTNVEAEWSPTRQRGFQIWLWSDGLNPDQRRAVAKRLGDFRLPPGVPPDPGAFARHAYFRLPDGLYVIARTVPSPERDKFGRGGRFHAHAVVLTEDEFRPLGFDPFRVIDGGFRFHNSPAETRELVGWPVTNLPRSEVTPADPRADVPSLPPGRVAELLAHAEQTADKPMLVVVPERPDRVLGWLRGLFAALPPCVRRRFGFDTLAAGAFDGDVPFKAAGAFSPDLLRLWSYRRYHKLDPATGACTPPLPPPAAGLPGEVVAAAGWRGLSEADRDALYATARALAAGRPDELPSELLTPAVVTVLEGCPEGFAAALALAVRARVSSDVPAPLARLPEVEEEVAAHYTGPVEDVLDRLRMPIPREVVDEGLRRVLKTIPASEPKDETLEALKVWLKTGHQPADLTLIYRRWRGRYDDLEKIEQMLAAEADESGWRREWVAGSLAGVSPEGLEKELRADRPPPDRTLRDARLWLALHPDFDSGRRVGLAMAVAAHRGPAALTDAIRRYSTAGLSWLVRDAAGRLADRCAPGWVITGPDAAYIGLFVTPAADVERAALTALADAGRNAVERLRTALWPIEPPKLTAGDVEPSLPGEGEAHFQAVLRAGPGDRAGCVARYAAYLRAADDEAFRLCANLLLQQVYGDQVLEEVGGGAYLVGLRLVWTQMRNLPNQLGLFEAVAGACAPAVPPGGPGPPGDGPDPQQVRRFGWLTARLADVNGTQRWRI